MAEARNPLRAIFDEASEIADGEQRSAYLERVCGGDAALRANVEGLLKSQETAGGFLADPKRDSPPAFQVAEREGDRIGRYKLLQKIGEGGCGIVYMAEQTEPVRRRVALKVIKLGMDTRSVMARFEAERQALALMDHAHIARVLDAGATESGRPYFVMELVRGIKITEYCDQNNLSTTARLRLFIQVCQAVQHAHQKGIIHRDLKPSNILVTSDDGVPLPKVIDFGIAKATADIQLTDKTLFTRFETFIGTPAYMSPEQAEFNASDVDTRTDIYALGVLLYELLTGHTPFDTATLLRSGLDALRKTIRETDPPRPSTRLTRELAAAEVAQGKPGDSDERVCSRRLLRLRETARELRGDLDWIILKALEKDRTRRYETANGLAMDIQRYLANELVAARPPSTAYRFQKAWQRNKLILTSVGLIAFILLAGTGISTWQAMRATRAQHSSTEARAQAEAERQRADVQAQNASASERQSRRLLYAADINLAQQALNLNNLGKARRLLDRHRPAPREEDLRGWEWRYLWQSARGAPHLTLTNRPAVGCSVSLSPDGSFVAAGWRDGQIELWSVPGRRQLRILSGPIPFRPGRVAFSPVRNLLAATAPSNSVSLHDLDSGQESILWQVPAEFPCDVRDLVFSPDGSRLLIYGGSNQKQSDRVWVIDLKSAAVAVDQWTPFSPTSHFGSARFSPDNLRVFRSSSDLVKKQLTVECLELATGRKVWETEPMQDLGMTALAVSHDGQLLASASGYGESAIHIWDAATGRLVRRLTSHTAWVSKLAFTRNVNGERLISSSADQTIRCWDARTWVEIKALRGHADEVQALAVAAAAPVIASAGKDGDVKIWTEHNVQESEDQPHLPADYVGPRPMPLDGSRFLLLPQGRTPQVIDLRHNSPPGIVSDLGRSENVLAQVGGFICHWKAPREILVSEWRGNEFKAADSVTLDSAMRPLAVAFHPARRIVAWSEATSPDSVSVVRLSTTGPRIQLTTGVTGMVPAQFSEQGDYLLGHARASIRVWNIETGRLVASVDGPIREKCLAGGGHVLVVVLQPIDDHEVQFHDLRQPGHVRRLPGRHFPNKLAVSPDGGLVALSTRGTQLRLFDAVRGEAIEPPLQGHPQGNGALTFSSDGRRLISIAARLETLKVWDVGSRQELLSLPGSSDDLQYADWSADGDAILGGPKWQIWRAPSWEEIAAAERKD